MGRKHQKRKRPPGPKGAPEWVVTFTDMISLLVTFFVLLMTFSSLESYDMVKIDAWLFGKRGVLDSRGSNVAEAPESDLVSEASMRRGASQPHTRPSQELDENLAEMGQKKTDAHQELAFDAMPDGLVLAFGEAEAFEPGSSRVNAALAQALAELGEVLQYYQHLIVVEGFTDAAFQPTADHATAEALAFARARNAADALLASTRIVPERVQVAGLGAPELVASGDGTEGRAQNSRVQVRILSLSAVHAAHVGQTEGR